VPGYPVVPVLGALTSFALIGFMQPTSQLIGVAIMALSAVWYYYYARDVKLREAL
jgi:hypothetical protein